MAETKIEWTAAADGSPGYSFNPWVGCTKISPGCDRCYAEGWAKRSGLVAWGGAPRKTSAENWRKPMVWQRKAVVSGIRARVFCASLADVFDNQAEPGWRMDLWRLIAATPDLDWLLLTKRPQNIRKMLPDGWGDGWPNVWLGSTVEDRERAAQRLPVLGATPATVRFISAEPLIEDWSDMLPAALARWRLDWIICGGESGGGARDMPADWARRLRDATLAGGSAFFMKQMSRKADIPADLLVRQFPAAAI